MPKGGPVSGAVVRLAPQEDPAQLRLIADNLPAMTVAYDERLRCTFANRRFAEFFGFTTGSIVGKHLRDVVGAVAYREVEPHLERVLKGEHTRYERTRVLKSGEKRYLEVELIPHIGESGKVRGLFAVTTDATERRRESHLRTLGLTAATLIAEAESARDAIRSVIRAICESEGWDCGRYHQPDASGRTMRQIDAWGIDDPAVQRYLERTSTVDHLLGKGLVGVAWAAGEPVWIPDAGTDPRALLRGMTSELRLRAALHFPVKAGGATIGVLGFNSRERREPDEGVLSVIHAVGAQIGQFLERKRAEDDLRRFRVAMDASGDIILLIDPVRVRYVDANATACRMLGYTREELLQLPPEEIVAIPREQLAREYQRLLEDPSKRGSMLGTYRRKDGSSLPFESTRQVVPSGEGFLVAAISRDITARTAAERALRASGERFRTVVESANEGIVEYDAEDHIVSVNSAAVRILGVPREKLIGAPGFSSLLPCIHEDGTPVSAASRFTGQAMASKQAIVNRMIGILRESDATTWVAANTALLYASGETEPYGAVMTLTDITRLKRDEALLRLEHDVARAFDETLDARSALAAAMRAVCEGEKWDSGRYLEVAGGELRPFCDWCIDDPAIRRYIENSRGMTYPRGIGMVGMAWQRREPEWIPDIWNDARVARPQLARDTGTRAALAVPVLAQDEVIGVLMFQTRQVRQPDERLLVAMELLGGQIGQLVRRAKAEDAMRESEARFRSLCTLSSDVFWEQDAEMRFTSVTGRTALDASAMLGKRRWEIGYTNLSKQDWAVHQALLDARQPFRDLEFRLGTPDGGEVWYSVSGEPMFDAGGKFQGYRGVGRDVSARKRDEERIRHLASHDALTGLPNRTAFSELLNAAKESARRHARALAVMFVDLDRFKLINDTLGHEVGDQVLCEVARRLRETLRGSDVVARLGGDEFVVMIPELRDRGQAETAARKVLAALVKPMLVAGRELTVSGSIGIALYPQDGEDEQVLMKTADTAMYRAKEAGKNNFKFHSGESDRRALERLAMETSLRKGLERGEFFLHYQPRVSLQTGAVTGVEALVRWRHPELGIVPPGEFIALAEETGTIQELGAWVLREACAQGAAWERDGLPPVHIAVNVSLRQIANDELPAQVAQALKASGFAAERLEIEITESVLAQNAERAVQLLTAIRALGVRIALDDFGTGYSSLSQLRRLPIDTLKVDRAFVAELPHSTEDGAIARAVITMGKSLRLVVVAEGVENAEQQGFLQAHGCDEMQGYLYSRPMPAGDCAAFLRRAAVQ